MRKSLSCLIFILSSLAMFAQDYALAQLENSPRHHEWVQLRSQDRILNCFVAYPESAEKTLAIIVIHENRGLTDWVRSMTDQLAEAGYLAIAPDLLSGFSDEYESTADFPSSDEARNAIYKLEAEKVTADLNAVQTYISEIPACNGNTAVMGFCWGGSQCFRFATNNDQIKAALVFYGTAPKDSSVFSLISAPVYGFYGGNDQRVNASIEQTEAQMQKNGKNYEYEIYEGAGHAYMRRGDNPEGEGPNREGRNASWERIKMILGEI